MKTNHSETKFEQLAVRIGEWAILRDFKDSDVGIIVEVIETLHAAEEALFRAGFLAKAVYDPSTLKFSWTTGKEQLDRSAALEVLKQSARDVVLVIEETVFGPIPGAPKPEPSQNWFYLIRSNGGKVTIESPFPLNMHEICGFAIRQFVRKGFRFGRMLEISSCDDQFVPKDTVSFSLSDELIKAGLVEQERRSV
ncbi:MAG: hypothetical protein J0M04_05725 [Verrucomicrobia bacterium]|nr:hypothetical protein [Verrucomicrobiota bacterium]